MVRFLSKTYPVKEMDERVIIISFDYFKIFKVIRQFQSFILAVCAIKLSK